ncbi:MAG TPA: DUF6544 family protein [Gemmatimonadales bacterium]|nr:DUF6544 family protein [Gemmatimonadales bacterium]
MSARRRLLFLVGGVLLVTLAVLEAGALHWNAGTRELREELQSVAQTLEPRRYDAAMLDSLPAPVARYLRRVLKDGQPMIDSARFTHRGRFNMGEDTPEWTRFSSDQLVVPSAPGFDWDGRISLGPGISVRVHDAFVEGTGVLHASVAGLFTVAEMRATPELAEAELQRYLAEAVWYPTALLPGHGLSWSAIDDSTATATLVSGATTVSLEFGFDSAGLVRTARTDHRYRSVGKTLVPTPWEGRFQNYAERNGMLIPLQGEVAWLLPAGRWLYWQGELISVDHCFTP